MLFFPEYGFLAPIMTPSARIQSVQDLFHRILSNNRIQMDGIAGDYFRSRRFIGSKDRANIAERAYMMMRYFARLNWWCQKLDITPDARHLVLLYLILVEKMGKGDLAAIYDGSNYAPDPLDESELALSSTLFSKDIHDPDMPIDARYECPSAHVDRIRALDTDFVELMTSMMTSASLDLRVNMLKCTRDQALASLRKEDVPADPTPYSPTGIRLRGKVFLSDTSAFKQGLVDIQDEGSQLIATVCGVAPGMQVLDYCAGAGGKTLALAGMMGNKGRIVATDTEPARLEKSRLRFRRAGVHDIIEVRPLSDEKNRKWLRRQKGTFDVTLVDAPCSGSGTWRRNPDGRWRTFGPTLDELMTIQADILDRVAQTVKPGGRLVYATCSLFRDENEDQVVRFLDGHSEFRVAPIAEIWPVGSPCPVSGDFLRLYPHTHHTDGFFAAVLVRAAGEISG